MPTEGFTRAAFHLGQAGRRVGQHPYTGEVALTSVALEDLALPVRCAVRRCSMLQHVAVWTEEDANSQCVTGFSGLFAFLS